MRRHFGRVVESSVRHGRLDLAARRSVAKSLAAKKYARAIILPNTWKSALAHFSRASRSHRLRRRGALGALERRRAMLQKHLLPRLVNRYGGARRRAGPSDNRCRQRRSWCRTLRIDRRRLRALSLKTHRPVACFARAPSFGPAKRWPPHQFAELASLFVRDGFRVWLIGSPNDKLASRAVLQSMGEDARQGARPVRPHRPRHAIDLLSQAASSSATIPV